MRRSRIFVEDILPNCSYHVAARTQQEKLCASNIHVSTFEIATIVTSNRTLAFRYKVSPLQTCATDVVVYTALRH